MQEQDSAVYEYDREIADSKLICLRLLKKLYIIVLSTLLGAVLFGGIYFVIRRLLPPEKEYEAKMTVYLEYRRGEEEPLGWVCFTQEAWKEFVTSDDFVKDVLQNVSGTVTGEEYLRSLSSVLLPDGRVLAVTISTPDPAKSVAIAQAVVKAVDDFAETQDRILWTRPLTVPEKATLKLVNDRTVNFAVLGAVVGFMVSVLLVLYMLTADDSVYVPELIACRFRIPAIGTFSTPELQENFENVYGNSIPVVLFVDDVTDEEKAETIKLMQEKTGCKGIVSKSSKEILSDDKKIPVLLAIKSGAHNGKRIRRMLKMLEIRGPLVCAAILVDADEALLRAYYGPWKNNRKKAGKDK